MTPLCLWEWICSDTAGLMAQLSGQDGWIFRRDPEFEAKAAVVLDLYQGFYQGKPLGPGDRIVSVDAKPSIQARRRRHPTTPPGHPVRLNLATTVERLA
jgi:hypothetical protein